MAGVIYDLRDVLEQQNECYEGLCILASYKTQAVIDKKIDFLMEVVEREEEFVGRLRVLDAQRANLMNDIAIVTTMNTREITLPKIIEKIGKETEVGQELQKYRDSILKHMDALKEQNHINKSVIEQSMEFVSFTLNAIKTTQYTQSTTNYAKPGTTQELQSISTFDQRQ